MTTSETLTNQQIVDHLETSFHPTRCKAILVDYENSIEFRLFDPNDKVTLTVKGTKTDSLRDVRSINELRDSIVERLRAKSVNKFKPQKP